MTGFTESCFFLAIFFLILYTRHVTICLRDDLIHLIGSDVLKEKESLLC